MNRLMHCPPAELPVKNQPAAPHAAGQQIINPGTHTLTGTGGQGLAGRRMIFISDELRQADVGDFVAISVIIIELSFFERDVLYQLLQRDRIG